MYSSKIDRFDWKLNGKKEMFVPYNAYRIEKEFKRDPKAVLTPHHVNPEYMALGASPGMGGRCDHSGRVSAYVRQTGFLSG